MKEYNDICRNEIFDGKERFLMCKIVTKNEEEAKKLQVNCDNFGRVRIFEKNKFEDWNSDPIPMAPMAKKMKLQEVEKLSVQMFEVAKCNLNCWWCYLPDELKKIDTQNFKWFTAKELMDLFLKENHQTKVIYISGGNPELVPELIYQIMKELDGRGLSQEYFLWSDDVLSSDYLLEDFPKEQLDYMIKYKNYIKHCCLKGFDNESYEYNTCLDGKEFENQLIRLEKFINLGFDVYSYIILTTENLENIHFRISNLMDRLQKINHLLPLRIIPIKIEKFSAVINRLNDKREKAIENQYEVLEIWNDEIKKRYSKKELELNIADIILK